MMEAVQAAGEAVAKRAVRSHAPKKLSHNLNGQRLGRKGRDTRERIIAVARELIDSGDRTPLTLSAVARVVGLGMSSLYNYFTDLTELLLAVLEPLNAVAEKRYVAHLREPWPDEDLNAHCLEFVTAFLGFWQDHAALMHKRNSLSDAQDKRMMAYRVSMITPIISLIVEQMRHDPTITRSPAMGMATVLYAGIERIVSIATDIELQAAMPGAFTPNVENFLHSEARLLELGIRDYRAIAAG